MLHDTHRTSAPSSVSVSMSTAVWIVMCRLPMMRAPASGFRAPCCLRSAISPGISCSARRISLRPNSACERSFTLYGSRPAAFAAANGCIFSVAVAILFSSVTVYSGSPGRRDEKRRPLCFRVRLQRDDPDVLESVRAKQALRVLLGKAEPHVTHLLAVAVAIVRQHVDDQRPSPGLHDARDLGERLFRLRHVMQHENQRRRI